MWAWGPLVALSTEFDTLRGEGGRSPTTPARPSAYLTARDRVRAAEFGTSYTRLAAVFGFYPGVVLVSQGVAASTVAVAGNRTSALVGVLLIALGLAGATFAGPSFWPFALGLSAVAPVGASLFTTAVLDLVDVHVRGAPLGVLPAATRRGVP